VGEREKALTLNSTINLHKPRFRYDSGEGGVAARSGASPQHEALRRIRFIPLQMKKLASVIIYD